MSDPTVDSLVISAPISGANATSGVLSEKNRSSHDRDIPSTGGEEARTQAVGDFGSQEDPENLKLAEAAIKVQAACRGYQVITALCSYNSVTLTDVMCHIYNYLKDIRGIPFPYMNS